MNRKLNKLQRLTQIISERQPLGIFTFREGQYYHNGEPISEDHMKELSTQYDKTIIMNIKIKC